MADEVTYKVLDVVGNRFTIKFFDPSGKTAILEADFDNRGQFSDFIAGLNPFRAVSDQSVDHSGKIGESGPVPPPPPAQQIITPADVTLPDPSTFPSASQP